jgi:hypothetical protein
MVLTPRQIHVLHGYSFAFGQYWQYKSSRARTSRLTTLHSVSVTTATAYPPFALAAAALCDAPDEGVLVCSRVTAAARVAPWRKLWWVPLCSGPAGLHVLLVSVAALSLGALKSIMLTVPPIGLIHLPLAYMGANLLRHVDTPLTPVRTIAVLGALSATPFLLLDEALELGLAALEAVRAVRDGGRPLEADEEADEGADVNEDASEDASDDAERPERAAAREKEEEEADGADDEEDEEADDALASDGGGDDRVVGQLRAFLAAIRPAGAPASRVAEEVAEGAAAAEGAVVEEVRYATISLPVRGGQSFDWAAGGGGTANELAPYAACASAAASGVANPREAA